MQRLTELINQDYFSIAKYSSKNHTSSLLYSQGNNVCLVQLSQPSPVGQSNPLRVMISIQPKSSSNILKVNEREQKIKSILETFIKTEQYHGAQMKLHLTLLQEGQSDILSTLVNAASFGLLKAGIQMKSTFFAFELFKRNTNEITVFKEHKSNIQNQIFLVLDVVNNLIGEI